MKQHPGYAIFEAYPLYNDTLIIPTEKSFNSEIIWLNNYLDSLDTYSFDQLNMQNKISYRVLENELKKQKAKEKAREKVKEKKNAASTQGSN